MGLMNRARGAAVAVTTAAILGAIVPTATAAELESPKTVTTDDAQLAVLSKVREASDPERALGALTPEEKLAYRDATAPVSAIVESEPAELVTTHASGGTDASERAAALASCWSQRVQLNWQSRWGFTVARTWQRLGWCGSGGRITSYELEERGGQAAAVGYAYEGAGGDGRRNVGWEVRSYTQEVFSLFGVEVIPGTTFVPCTQIRGGATGGYSQRTNCTL